MCTACPTQQSENVAVTVFTVLGILILLYLFLYFSRNADGGTLRPLISGWQSLTLVLMTGQEWPDTLTAIKVYALEVLDFDFVSLA